MIAVEKANRIKKVLILVVILILPGFFYFFLQEKGVNRYVSLPYYGNEIRGTDTSWHRVPIVSLRNEAGEMDPVPLGDTTVSVVNFFYTQCPSFCLRMHEAVHQLATRFSKSEMVRFYSVSVDSNDHTDDLQVYADRWEGRRGNWHFYTSKRADIKGLSQKSYFLNAIRDTLHSNVIIVSSKLVLLDSKRRIRGYYDSTNAKEMARLTDEIRLLIAEERRQRKES